MKTFSGDDLERGDGQEERPTLVAVDGKVYDVSGSAMWTDGKHMNSHDAGQDLSLAIQAAPHGNEVMERVEQVGTLADPGAQPEARPFPTPPRMFAYLLGFHPHPISVHFPIALGGTASLFMLIHLVFGMRAFEVAALFNMGVATITAPPAILTGLLSWYYNYGGVWTPIFRKKAILSVVLVVLTPAALLLRLLVPESFGPGEAQHWIYAATVVITAPVVFGLGFLGGNITFPR